MIIYNKVLDNRVRLAHYPSTYLFKVDDKSKFGSGSIFKVFVPKYDTVSQLFHTVFADG